jgi:hypothetical protein
MHVLKTFLARYSSGGVLVELAKVLSKSALLLNAKVLLITEKDNASCSNQSCKVVLLRICELGQVHAVHFCADLWIVVKDVCS